MVREVRAVAEGRAVVAVPRHQRRLAEDRVGLRRRRRGRRFGGSGVHADGAVVVAVALGFGCVIRRGVRLLVWFRVDGQLAGEVCVGPQALDLEAGVVGEVGEYAEEDEAAVARAR